MDGLQNEPVQEQSACAEEQDTSGEEFTKPVREQSISDEEQSAPNDERSTPAEEQKLSGEDLCKPDYTHNALDDDGTASSQEQVTLAEDQNNSREKPADSPEWIAAESTMLKNSANRDGS